MITGYEVSEDAGVLVRSLDDAGAAISGAVRAGGNQVRLHGLRLTPRRSNSSPQIERPWGA